MDKFFQLIKRAIRKLTLREKFLLFAFVCVMLMIWINSQLDQLSDLRTTRAATLSNLAEQAIWLDDSENIVRRLRDALELVDPARTFSSTQLSGRIDGIARATRLTADIDPVNTREGLIFNDHIIRVRLSRVRLDRLMAFTDRLAIEAPYITLRRLELDANRASPEELNARFEITSFELKQMPEIPE